MCLRTCQAKGLEQSLGLTTLVRSWLEELCFEACRLNPCLLRSKKAVLLVHVDDIMVKGESKYILEGFAPKVRSRFDASLFLQ